MRGWKSPTRMVSDMDAMFSCIFNLCDVRMSIAITGIVVSINKALIHVIDRIQPVFLELHSENPQWRIQRGASAPPVQGSQKTTIFRPKIV